MANPKKTIKMMLVSGMSYNQVVALERELLWYTDQLLFRASLENAKLGGSRLEEKIEGMGLIAAVADKHADIHRQMLEGLAGLKNDPEPAGVDEKIVTLTFTLDQFETVAGALNSPFLAPKERALEGNFWKHLDVQGEERKAFQRHHTALVKAFKQAVSFTTEIGVEETEVEEQVLIPSVVDRFATMPGPRGEQ